MEAKNDEKGLAACYVRQKEALKHYIASRIDRPDEAEDVVQDVFERLWKHKDFISPEAVVSLAYKVARNLMADRQRRYRKENDVWGELFYTQEALQDTTEEKVSFKELKLMFDRLVFALPEKRRKAYCLSFLKTSLLPRSPVSCLFQSARWNSISYWHARILRRSCKRNTSDMGEAFGGTYIYTF